jgi:TonB family protein
MKTTLVVAVTLSATLGLTLSAQQRYTPARFEGGAPPGLAPMAVGGGQAIVELSVGASGRIDKVRTVRSTPPFTQLLLDTLVGWRFSPATEIPPGKDGKPDVPRHVASKVIVAAVYRAPVVQGPTQGEPPVNVATPSADVAFPSSMPEPLYPATAQFGGVVMIEARVNASGAVTNARVLSSAPPFDRPALAAASQWRFRPPRIGGSTESYAYLIFGFPQPVTTK